MSRYVRWGDRLLPRALAEPVEPKYEPACTVCGDMGIVLETIDEDRHDVVLPCWACKRFCKACGKWVAKRGHKCVEKGTQR